VGYDLEAKLDDFDRSADASVTWLLAFLEEYREPLIHLARGRQVAGHFLYGDKLMYEYDRERLVAEIAEELADAIVYGARRLDLA
jgi:hypothetical protein